MSTITAHWFGTGWAGLAVLLGYAVVALAHLVGLRRMTRSGSMPMAHAPGGDGARPGDVPARPDLIRQAVAFQLGLLFAVLAVVSPIGYWSTVYVWVHGLQDLLLAFLAPGLIVLGAPWQPLRWCWRPPGAAASLAGETSPAGQARDRLLRAAPAGPAAGRWWLARPVAVAVAFNAVWLGWHLPALFDPTRSSALAALAEYACYLGVGVLFWLQLIGSRPSVPAASPLRRFALVTSTVITSTVLGMILVFGSGVYYPAFAGTAHHVLTLVDDQQLSGAVLWMGMLPQAVVVAVALLLRWLDDEESGDLSAGFDRLLVRRKSAWPSRPGLR
ncbi:MAG: cytochrome c oxidase assembly protein [Streptosporangiaceae bacterium]|jgi:cytochrome c oxidase assembly factor CtaG